MPDSPEAFYDLARVQISMNKTAVGLQTFKRAVELSKANLATNPEAFNVVKDARTNNNFQVIRNDPTFKALTAP